MTQPQPDFDEVVAMLSQRVGDLTAQLALAQSVINGYAKRDAEKTDKPEGGA